MLDNRAPLTEYQQRWSQTQDACREAGVEALVVWSKGGGPIDTSEDVVYLANHYAVFPYCADSDGVSGLGASALVLPLDGEPILIVGGEYWRRENVPVSNVRVTGTLPDEIAAVLRERGLLQSRIGLVAGASMTVEPYRRLLAMTEGVEFVPMDVELEKIRAIKSPFEFELLRESCEVGNAAMLAMMSSATRVGTTEVDAVLAAHEVVLRAGGTIIDAAVASGPNSHFYAYGQMPQWTTRTLEQGDLFHCDMYGAVSGGYRWDFSRTTVNGGAPSAAQLELIDGTIAAVEAGVAAVKPGATTGEVWNALHNVLVQRGIDVGYDIGGHSYGLAWEGPWIAAGGEDLILPGMAIAVETIGGVKGLGNAKFEHNLLVHDDRIELLSTCPDRPWL